MRCGRLDNHPNKSWKGLQPGLVSSKDVHENTEIEEIILMAESVGVGYDSYWNHMCAQVNAIQKVCSPWREEDFSYPA